MTHTTLCKKQDGFTLVELAIVLMIIGLLIGGVLRGQELIENARVTSTIQQLPAFDTAVTTFRGTYGVFPGDMTNPATRIANCVDDCATGGNQNGFIGPGALTATSGSYPLGTGENVNFWTHLAAARLLGGVNPRGGDNGGTYEWGTKMPSAKIGGGFHVAQVSIPAVSGGFSGANGLYVALVPAAGTTGDATMGVNFAASAGIINPSRAAQMDRKMDDGNPQAGDAIGVGATAGCTGTTYDETVSTNDCGMIFRIQG